MSPSPPHHVVSGAAAGDLLLALAGVRLPWPVLGGRLGEMVSDTVCVDLPTGLATRVDEAREVVLTDETSLPLGRLVEVRIEGSRAAGRLEPVSSTPARPEWLDQTGQVLLLQRPPLRGELVSSSSRAPARVLLVPEGLSPDGLPAQVLRRAAVAAATATEPDGIQVLTAPVVWRDDASDAALVKAVADRAGGAVDVLWADDEGWAGSLTRLEAGDHQHLDDAVVATLAQWRRPPAARGVVAFFTGFSGSGKSTIADALVAHVEAIGERTVTLLDGDVVRQMLSAGLGFDRQGRDLNIRRIGYVAAEIAHHHGMAVCAPIAPFAATRSAVREMVERFGDFVLVHISTPLEECERRDRKGLYARARAGEIADFTGISSPYELPTDADLTIDTTGRSVSDALSEVVDHLVLKGYLTS